MSGIMLALAGSGGAVSVSISPASQTLGPSAPAGAVFSGATLVAVGGTPSAYLWSLVSPLSGTWSINSGQGTATCVALVAGVASPDTATCTLRCVATINGVDYAANSSLSYQRT